MTPLYRSKDKAAAAVDKLRILAQPQRLMILSALLERERTVGEIETVTGVGQPALSQQLGELRRSDAVKARRESKQVYYRLADASIANCVRTVEAMFGGEGMPHPSETSTARSSIVELTAGSAASFARVHRTS